MKARIRRHLTRIRKGPERRVCRTKRHLWAGMPPAAREGRDEYAGGGEDTRENTPRWRREAPPLPPEPFRKSDEARERVALRGAAPGQREAFELPSRSTTCRAMSSSTFCDGPAANSARCGTASAGSRAPRTHPRRLPGTARAPTTLRGYDDPLPPRSGARAARPPTRRPRRGRGDRARRPRARARRDAPTADDGNGRRRRGRRARRRAARRPPRDETHAHLPARSPSSCPTAPSPPRAPSSCATRSARTSTRSTARRRARAARPPLTTRYRGPTRGDVGVLRRAAGQLRRRRPRARVRAPSSRARCAARRARARVGALMLRKRWAGAASACVLASDARGGEWAPHALALVAHGYGLLSASMLSGAHRAPRARRARRDRRVRAAPRRPFNVCAYEVRRRAAPVLRRRCAAARRGDRRAPPTGPTRPTRCPPSTRSTASRRTA